jgi:predicted DNA-binding transcriptional regulator AlpA
MELLTAQELWATLKISRTTLYRYTLAGMPHLGHGRLRRFPVVTSITGLRSTRH